MRRKGFTLVEMMIVVAILSVLAVVAGTAYRRYLDSARTTEAYAMLGEIRSREEAYRAEFSAYVSTTVNNTNETLLFPAVDSGTCYPTGTKEPCQKAANPATGATLPDGWAALGINPGRTTLACGYLAIARNAGTTVPGTQGQGLLGTTSINTPWWYAIAVCDNDGNSAINATFVTAYNTTVVTSQNEHK